MEPLTLECQVKHTDRYLAHAASICCCLQLNKRYSMALCIYGSIPKKHVYQTFFTDRCQTQISYCVALYMYIPVVSVVGPSGLQQRLSSV